MPADLAAFRHPDLERYYLGIIPMDPNFPGYVVDHIVPLKRGGIGGPSNMQWQTVEESRAKRPDRIDVGLTKQLRGGP